MKLVAAKAGAAVRMDRTPTPRIILLEFRIAVTFSLAPVRRYVRESPLDDVEGGRRDRNPDFDVLFGWRFAGDRQSKGLIMAAWIVGYLVTALVFLACDAVWLSLAASRLYRRELSGLLMDGFNLGPAAAFYFIYIAGILILAVWPALQTGRWTGALLRGAVLGCVAYATYDLTNQATLRGWSGLVTIADLCWGTLLTGTAATAGFIAVRWMSARG